MPLATMPKVVWRRVHSNNMNRPAWPVACRRTSAPTTASNAGIEPRFFDPPQHPSMRQLTLRIFTDDGYYRSS